MVTASKPDGKARLLEAALTVIRTKGYADATVDELCREAGVSKGSFFHHFAEERLARSPPPGTSRRKRPGSLLRHLTVASPIRANGSCATLICGHRCCAATSRISHASWERWCKRRTRRIRRSATCATSTSAFTRATSLKILRLQSTRMRPMRRGRRRAWRSTPRPSFRARSFLPRLTTIPRPASSASRTCAAISKHNFPSLHATNERTRSMQMRPNLNFSGNAAEVLAYYQRRSAANSKSYGSPVHSPTNMCRPAGAIRCSTAV